MSLSSCPAPHPNGQFLQLKKKNSITASPADALLLSNPTVSTRARVCVCVSGFPIRRVFDEFMQRYGAISPSASNIDALLYDLVQKVRCDYGWKIPIGRFHWNFHRKIPLELPSEDSIGIFHGTFFMTLCEVSKYRKK